MTIKLADLPYEKDALEPHISARTLGYHHDRHHKAYVDQLNEAIENTGYSGLSLEEMIARSHGTSQFGSGWAWLVLDKGELNVISTSDADNPLIKGQKPLLTLDLWEHAYYLDYQNERGVYVDTFLEHLINWKFASASYDALTTAA